MYRRRTRNRPIGGKMLKKLFIVFSLILSVNALACWKVEGTLAVDGETFKIHQKVDHGKEYILPMGNFLFKFTIKPSDKKFQTMKFVIEEKKDNKLITVSKGEEDIEEGRSNDVFAKGEEGQPNSIITIKLSKI